MEITNNEIQFSVVLEHHPVLAQTTAYKNMYLALLRYFTDTFCPDSGIADILLQHYQKAFLPDGTGDIAIVQDAEEVKTLIRKISRRNIFRLRFSSYCGLFFTDCLLLCAENDFGKANILLENLKTYFHPKYHKKLDDTLASVHHNEPLKSRREPAANMLEQFRKNIWFLHQPLKTVLITATMSAGKSTLINAIVGKPLARTAQEACTGALHLFLNKPFEDNLISLSDQDGVFLDVAPDDLLQSEARGKCTVSTYFSMLSNSARRLCIVDTPGVNSAIEQTHGQITADALRNQAYDQILYLFRADGLGRDEDLSYLKQVSDMVPKEKILFMVNKLDLFKTSEDSIQESLNGVREDLRATGYENPVLCPISAYFAYLVKQKLLGQELSEDEEDEFNFYVKKFRKPKFDLSCYYPAISDSDTDNLRLNDGLDDLRELGVKCGLYGLERLLLGA